MEEAEGAFASVVMRAQMEEFTSSLERTQQSAAAVGRNIDRWTAVPTSAYVRVDGPFPRAGCGCFECQRAHNGANHVARALLRDHLTDEQERQLAERERFLVTSQGGRTYSIGGSEVVAVDGPMERTRFCIQLYDYPEGDADLARKLLLETDELEFLREAVGGRAPERLAIADDLEAKGLAAPDALAAFRARFAPAVNPGVVYNLVVDFH